MKWTERGLDLVTLALLVGILLSLLDFSLVFRETMVAGGDMISHPAIVDALKEQWARGQFWAWNHGWFAGYPHLYYYFYPIYVFAAALGALGFSDVVAFKMAVAAVVLSVPSVTFIFARRWLTYPLALLLASGMLLLFLNEFDSRSGGNLKSLLAGQISHELGLVWLTVLYGYLARRKFDGPGAAFALSMTVLCHVYTALYAAALVGGVFVWELIRQRSWSVFKEYRGIWLALGLTAFFWAPFVVYRAYTVAPINHSVVPIEHVINLLQLRNPYYVAMYAGMTIGLLGLLFKRSIVPVLIVGFLLATGSAASLQSLDGTPILHIRLPAQIYLLALLGFVGALHFWRLRQSIQWMFVAPIALIFLQSFVPAQALDSVFPKSLRNPVIEGPGWWAWNMSGIENKSNADDVLSLWSYLRMAEIGDARVSVEYGDYNRYGSPRIFEMTYAVTRKPIMEGLLLESSTLYPSYFYASFFIVPTTWWPGFPVQVPPPDMKKGIEYMGRFHVGVYVAATEKVKEGLRALGYRSLYKNDAFEAFEVNQGSALASVVEGEVPVVFAKRPLYESVLNYPKSLDFIYLVKQGDGPGLKEVSQPALQKLTALPSGWSEDKQTLKVDAIPQVQGQKTKIYFKMPYFPNWRVQSGESVQLATPNMMLVETDKSSIQLEYAPGIAERISGMTSLLAWFALFLLIMLKLKTLVQSLLGGSFGRSVFSSHSSR